MRVVMEEAVLPLSTDHCNSFEAFMDFDCMDALLLEGFWLEANGSEDCAAPVSPFDPSFAWPTLESGESLSKAGQEERQRSSLPDNLSISSISNPVVSSAQCLNYSVEGSEQSKRCWIRPRVSMSVMERLIQALVYMKSSSGDKDVLIQVWVPVTRGPKRVLTTNDQPFSVDLNCLKLANYRQISVKYDFPADEDSEEVVGLPGRVYKNKVPEWTPDVRFFSWKEYPRVGHAQQYDVQGTLAVPILEHGNHSCLGVIEHIFTTQKIQYRPELENVCRALEAVDLRSPQVSNRYKLKTCDLLGAGLAEIREVLRCACETHELPLAQTWVPCILQGDGRCWNSDNFKNCAAPVESACYVGDARVKGFHEACSEYHLLKGQGVVGRAFLTNQPCFSIDVAACSKTDYPLSHHARMFGLKAAVAIRLRSTSTGSTDFVLEFFLPTKCDNPDKHEKILASLLLIIRNICQTLRVVSDKELNNQETAVSSNPKESMAFADNSTLYANKRKEKRRVKAKKTITLQIIRQHFAGSLKDAARNLGVCPTTLKRICRQHGIQRWPSRKIKKVGHSLQKIQRVINSVQGGFQIESFYSNYFPHPAAASLSPSSSCSQNSSSSRCSLSAGGQGSSVFGMPKRTRSYANLHLWSDGAKPFCWPEKQENDLSGADGGGRESRERDGPRIKVTYGEDTIRLRMQSNWGFEDLIHEICRRFGVDYADNYHLRYLDDDAEWVLLTCEADLEECIDVCGSSQSRAIKFTLSCQSIRSPQLRTCQKK